MAPTAAPEVLEAADVCDVKYLGLTPYQEAWDLQRQLGALRSDGRITDSLLLLEHPPTYTLGRTAERSNILIDEADLTRLDIGVFDIDRGGDVTFHGPGQLVGYPILLVEDRRDLLQYIRKLEQTLILSLADYGISSGRIEGLSGVWIGDAKIAAIGVKMGRVTSHGFALNVSTDLSYFRHIIPCGIRDKGVTSMTEQLGMSASMPTVEEMAGTVSKHFGNVFGRRMVAKRPVRALSLN